MSTITVTNPGPQQNFNPTNVYNVPVSFDYTPASDTTLYVNNSTINAYPSSNWVNVTTAPGGWTRTGASATIGLQNYVSTPTKQLQLYDSATSTYSNLVTYSVYDVGGALTATEAGDTLSAAGSGASSPKGTLSATEASDTLSAAGNAKMSGALTATEASDTLSAGGGTGLVGSLAATEANDTLVAAAQAVLAGVLAQTEGSDTLVAAMGALIGGILAATEGADTLSAAGASSAGGSLSLTEVSDALTAAGNTLVRASLLLAENPDTLSAAGQAVAAGPVHGSLTATEQSDALTGVLRVVRQNKRNDLSVLTFQPVAPPSTGITQEWMQNHLQSLQSVINQVALAVPQVAYKAPATPLEGMMRLAKGGWNPTGVTGYDPNIGQLVIYHGGSWVAV